MAEKKKINKVLLAFSGGLDTSAIVPWLQDTYGAEVIAYCADLGNGPDEEYLTKWSKQLGASQFIFEDLQEEFVKSYAFPCVRAGAHYQQDYLLGTAIARPLIAERMAEWAKKLGADAIAHGATGKGNDQLRFEKSWAYLVPDVEMIAPWKIWDFKGRQDLADYLATKGFEVSAEEKTYSVDINLFHRSCEGGVLEFVEKDYSASEVNDWVKPMDQVSDEFFDVALEFKGGVPTALNGQTLSARELLAKLNEIAGQCGIGSLDLVEERNIGIKSRGIYETPGGTVLFAATKALKGICWSRSLLKTANHLSIEMGELVYDGHWHSDLMTGLLAFFEKSGESLCGKIGLKLQKGQIKITKRESELSLYSDEMVTFESDEQGMHQAAAGYCMMSSMGQKAQGLRLKKYGV